MKQKLDNDKTKSQEAYVRESLSRALQEVHDSRCSGKKLQTADDFLDELKK